LGVSSSPFFVVFLELASIMAESSWFYSSCDRNSVPYMLILKISRLAHNHHCWSNCSLFLVFFLL
jgi:hypothetical protein